MPEQPVAVDGGYLYLFDLLDDARRFSDPLLRFYWLQLWQCIEHAIRRVPLDVILQRQRTPYLFHNASPHGPAMIVPSVHHDIQAWQVVQGELILNTQGLFVRPVPPLVMPSMPTDLQARTVTSYMVVQGTEYHMEQRPRVCSACGRTGNDLRRCAECLMISYCNVACQRSDWARHKVWCRWVRS